MIQGATGKTNNDSGEEHPSGFGPPFKKFGLRPSCHSAKKFPEMVP